MHCQGEYIFHCWGNFLLTLTECHQVIVFQTSWVAVAENPELDMNIQEEGVDEDLNFLHGFGGEIDLSSSEGTEPLIWLPILGEDKLLHLQKAYAHLKPGEICPILPFPSRNPRRPDALTMTYHELLFDELRIEPQKYHVCS